MSSALVGMSREEVCNMDLKIKCPRCGKQTELEVDAVAYGAYMNGERVERAFPEFNRFQRELFISGYCYDCQEKEFGVPADEHREEWGEEVGKCPICGRPIWSKHDKHKKDNDFDCPECHNTLVIEDGELEVKDQPNLGWTRYW